MSDIPVRPGSERQGALYGLIVVSNAALYLVTSSALLILMLATVIGPFNFMAHEPGERAIGLWHLPSLTGFEFISTRRRREAWMSMLPADLPVVHAQQLTELITAGVPVIGMPDSRKLSEKGVKILTHYVEQGGALVLTGSVAVRKPDNSWRGYELMSALLDVPSVRSLDRGESGFVSAARRGPLSSGLVPGQRLRLMAEAGVPAIEGPLAELRWQEHAQTEGQVASAASKRIELGKGRVVWIAVGPENVVSDVEEEHRAMTRVLQAGLAWALREPLIELLPWPGGAAFPATLVTDRSAAVAGSEELERIEQELLGRIAAGERTGEPVEARIPVGSDPTPATLELLHDTRAMLGERSAWLARGDEIDLWRERHARVKTRLRRPGPQRLQLDVTNGNEHAIDGIVLRIYLNRPVSGIRVAATELGGAVPEVDFRAEAEYADLHFRGLPPRASRALTMDLED